MRCNSAQLVALADPDTQTLETAVKEFDPSHSFSNYRAMLDTDVEAVIVAAPTKFHYEILLDLVHRGKSIFVEKPITFTLDEAEKISALSREKNVYLQVGFMRRFDPGFTAAKELIDAQEIGEPIYIHCLNRDPSGPPKSFIPDSGGLFVDMGIHDLDSACWLMGSDIVEIYAQGGVFKHGYVGEAGDIDEGQMLLKFANGKLGTIEVSRNANGIMDVRTEVVGTRESVYIGQTQTTPIT